MPEKGQVIDWLGYWWEPAVVDKRFELKIRKAKESGLGLGFMRAHVVVLNGPLVYFVGRMHHEPGINHTVVHGNGLYCKQWTCSTIENML